MATQEPLPERCCAKCEHLVWLVALGQGIRCHHPANQSTEQLPEALKHVPGKAPAVRNRRLVCERFEPFSTDRASRAPQEKQGKNAMNQQTPTSLDTAARAHDAFVKSDSVFQRRARLLQALWREAEGLPVGLHREAPLGSRLAMPRAEERLENYLTPVIRNVVKREVLDSTRSAGKLFARPRIFNDLLSSQPLCFNLFAELGEDLELATRVLRRLVRTGVGKVNAIEFEWSPGRGDERYTGDKSAFDVFVRYNDEAGKPCFVGIEVKYHENLQDTAARLRPRYEEVAQSMDVFDKERLVELRAKPLQQVWRDHLLAGSMLATGEWSRGEFVFLYPRDNERCQAVVTRYAECLTDDGTFAAWTLEGVVDAIRGETDDAWVDAFCSRYLAFDRVDAVIATVQPTP